MPEEQQQGAPHKKLVTKLFCLVFGMFAFGYALVPLYNVMCKQLGINGKTSDEAVQFVQGGVDKSRTITVEFLSTNHGNLTWQFYPTKKRIKLHPGEMRRIAYFAENTTEQPMRVQAIPSVTPGIAAKYLRKTECFCFTQQMLEGGKNMDMPLLFHVDRDLPKKITTITLSYTLFDVTGARIRTNKTPGRIS